MAVLGIWQVIGKKIVKEFEDSPQLSLALGGIFAALWFGINLGIAWVFMWWIGVN
jgi:hypothetical protein